MAITDEGPTRLIRHPRLSALVAFALPVIAPTSAPKALAQASLEVIDGRDGGKIVYGVMEHASPAAAMGSVLHYVHHAFGDPPVVGKVFQSRDGQNFRAFFTPRQWAAVRSRGD